MSHPPKKRLWITVLLSGLMLAACAKRAPEAQSLTYGLTLAPSGIDPHINASAELGIPLSSVYDTLVVQDPQTRAFLPSLATEWDVSPDGLTYTFKLRRDVRFHDGTPFDAQAVVANIHYITNPDHHSQKAIFMLGPLDTVEAVDEFTVVFRLKEPFAPLLDSLSQVYLGMASPEALESYGPAEYQFHQLGTGPYRFVEYIPNDRLVLERNPDYAWAPPVVNREQASVERIAFRFYEDPATRALALERGEVDVIGEVPPRDAARLEKDPAFLLYEVAIPGQPMQFFFNTQRSPTDDLKVRRALLMALDRPQIVDTLFGPYSPVANAPLSSDLLPPVDAPGLRYDPEGAAKLLDEAGWRLQGAVRRRDGAAMTLRIISPPWGSNPEAAQLMEAAWETLGIEVQVQVAPGFGPLRDLQAGGEYNLIGLNFFGTDPDLLRSFYHSQGFFNWSGLADPQVDAWLEEGARLSVDPQGRAERYRLVSARLMERAVIVPLRDYVNLVVARSDVQGLHFSAQGWFPYLIDVRLDR